MSSKAQERSREDAYRVYITDALKVLTENTAHPYGGTVMTKRYQDILHPQKEDTRSAEEILQDVIVGAGLQVVD